MDHITERLLNAVSGGGSGGGSSGFTYPEEVFSAYTYTGNATARNIVNDIDLTGNGGMVWLKRRDTSGNNAIHDSSRGPTHVMYTDSTGADTTSNASITAFNSNGFSLNSSSYYNGNNAWQLALTFRKAPKFFDIVTWTGNGAAARRIPHNLNCETGLIVIKAVTAGGDWTTVGRFNNGNRYGLKLNTTGQFTTATSIGQGYFTTTDFCLDAFASASIVNGNGVQYIAYVFAHDSSESSIIKCGEYQGNGSSVDVELGFEPQFVLIKKINNIDDWHMVDIARGFTTSGEDAVLKPNSANAEYFASTFSSDYYDPYPTGFRPTVYDNTAGHTYIYMAIKRPCKPALAGTDVFMPVARSSSGAAAKISVGFSPDLVMSKARNTATGFQVVDKMRGRSRPLALTTAAEVTSSAIGPTSFDPDGITVAGGLAFWSTYGATYVHYFFKRCPGFFDIVDYVGNGATWKTNKHNLGAVPELIIYRSRNNTSSWYISYGDFSKRLMLDSINAESTLLHLQNVTAASFDISSTLSGYEYLVYLFASKPGISKVGTYIGTNALNVIDCGFTTGARFVLIKRLDSTNNWCVWDTARGISSGVDPVIFMNAAQVEALSYVGISPDLSGFALPADGGGVGINVLGAKYLFLAIA